MGYHRAGYPERLLAFDIETVPDRDRLPVDRAGKFPKPVFHQVVSVSFVEAEIEIDGEGCERYRLIACRSGGETDWDEARLLAAFWAYFAKCPTRLVGWNSRGFDVPVLLQRSLVHGLAAPTWFRAGSRFDSYGYRYGDMWHADLMDQLADYGACTKLSLDETAQACGLPGKLGGHGSEVEAMLRAGEHDRIRAYCEGDTLNLYGLYLRFGLLTGRLSREGHDAAVQDLVHHLERERGTQPHLGLFLEAWREVGGFGGRPMPTAHRPRSSTSAMTTEAAV